MRPDLSYDYDFVPVKKKFKIGQIKKKRCESSNPHGHFAVFAKKS